DLHGELLLAGGAVVGRDDQAVELDRLRALVERRGRQGVGVGGGVGQVGLGAGGAGAAVDGLGLGGGRLGLGRGGRGRRRVVGPGRGRGGRLRAGGRRGGGGGGRGGRGGGGRGRGGLRGGSGGGDRGRRGRRRRLLDHRGKRTRGRHTGLGSLRLLTALRVADQSSQYAHTQQQGNGEGQELAHFPSDPLAKALVPARAPGRPSS